MPVSTTPVPGQNPAQTVQIDPAKLADIHLPDAIAFWPVAPGWWLLLGAIIIILLLLIYLIKRKPAIPIATGKELKSQAMQELHAIRKHYRSSLSTENATQTTLTKEEITHETVKNLSIFLRRYALSLYQRDNVASLTDTQWLALLDKIIDHDSTQNSDSDTSSDPSSKAKNGQFSQQFSTLLTQVPYQSTHEPIDSQLLAELFNTSEIMIKNSFKYFTANIPPQENTHV